MASPAPALKGVLSPGKWLSDEAATHCRQCKEEFTVFNRRHHCRGCGQLYCANCTSMSPLGQYGFTAAVMACLRCAAPYVAKAEPFVIPTSGGEVAYTIYNAGTDLSDIKLEFDGKEVPLNAASLVAARDGGTVLRVVMPSGRGTKHSVVIRRIQRGLAGKARISYCKPKLSRTSSLRTDGGELILYGENFGDDADAIRVVINGVAVAPADLSIKQPHTKIRVLAPAGTGLAQLRVEVGDQSDAMDLLRSAPEITAVDPPDVDMSGGRIELSGRCFGADASRVQVLLPDLGLVASSVTILEPHTRLCCVLPALSSATSPSTAAGAGDAVRVQVVVDGIHSISPANIVYCPPYGVPAKDGKPAYFPKRPSASAAAAGTVSGGNGTPGKGAASSSSSASASSSGGRPTSVSQRGGAAALAGAAVRSAYSPYADLFAATLGADNSSSSGESAAMVAAGSSSSSSSSNGTDDVIITDSSSSSKAGPVHRRLAATVRVGGTLSGGGPTLAITPPRSWAPDQPDCDLCDAEFTVTRRRHHCRICGCCVCAGCSPHALQLSSSKPSVRVCNRCNLRVGLLNQMTSVLDAIATIRKELPHSFYETFRNEVMEAILAPANGSASSPLPSQRGLASTPPASAGSSS